VAARRLLVAGRATIREPTDCPYSDPLRFGSFTRSEVRHGNSCRISMTCLLLKRGAPAPALRTGSPVIGSMRSFVFDGRGFRGVKTIRPPCTFASSESPAWRPSLRRMAPARTIWPLVDSFNSVVRKSYLGVCKNIRKFGENNPNVISTGFAQKYDGLRGW